MGHFGFTYDAILTLKNPLSEKTGKRYKIHRGAV